MASWLAWRALSAFWLHGGAQLLHRGGGFFQRAGLLLGARRQVVVALGDLGAGKTQTTPKPTVRRVRTRQEEKSNTATPDEGVGTCKAIRRRSPQAGQPLHLGGLKTPHLRRLQ
jgi:hypothetical protein